MINIFYKCLEIQWFHMRLSFFVTVKGNMLQTFADIKILTTEVKDAVG